MTVATGVVGRADRTTAVTRLLLAAEGGGAAGGDRPPRGALHAREPMGVLIARTVRANDRRQLESTGAAVSGRPGGRRTHGLARDGARRRRRRETEELNRRPVDGHRRRRDVQGVHRRLHRSVAEQALNGARSTPISRRCVAKAWRIAWMPPHLLIPARRVASPYAFPTVEVSIGCWPPRAGKSQPRGW